MIQQISLKPFPSTEVVPVQITGNISRVDNQLTINYQLVGDLQEIVIAQPADKPARQHELWQNTCFEFFLGMKNSPRYWEFNLSPAGHWNIYRFDSYRQGMQEEIAFNLLPFIVEHQSGSLLLSLKVDLDKIVTSEQPLDLAITTVVKLKNGKVTYWALVHQAKEADFHIRESFIVEI
ncbi:DOMON-like domain-containing protein [Anabaena azotica]|uniref:DOMON-like domain-containing protein n=1 Tax=Anabaena azotica FACHB-119 TaxID=947527 RepID=A0ABR8D5J9_9NOST|nr:DOMON-like domain-containing protein [Anabaena azotica]MBD2502216.1 DOMON-like domain-containing protein [Anabaena azotica FACHB-119]